MVEFTLKNYILTLISWKILLDMILSKRIFNIYVSMFDYPLKFISQIWRSSLRKHILILAGSQTQVTNSGIILLDYYDLC